VESVKKILNLLFCLTLLLGTASAATHTCQVYSIVDGSVGFNPDGKFAEVRNASIADAATTSAVYTYLRFASTSTSPYYDAIQRVLIVFPTDDCGITGSDTINSAEFVLATYKDTMQWNPALGVSITSQRMVSYTDIGASDYGRSDDNLIVNTKAYTDVATNGEYTKFAVINLTAINRTGDTAIAVRFAPDATNTPPTWSASKSAWLAIFNVEYPGTNYDPYINITWSDGGGGSAPGASFSANKTSGTAPLPILLTDSSTNSPNHWNYSFNNFTGNNTVVYFSDTTQNPGITLSVGNFSFALNASNAYGYNITPGKYWVNVSVAGKSNYFPNGKYYYYAYGDSITASSDYYLGQMKTLFNTSSTVSHNTDGSGKSSNWGLSEVNNGGHNNGTQVYVMFGVNDMNGVQTGLQVGQNLDQICDAIEANGSTCRILIKTMVAEDAFGYGYAKYTLQHDNDTIIQNYLASQGRSYIKTYDAIDTIPCNGVPDEWNTSFMTDSTHPNVLGHEYIARYVWNSTDFCKAYFPTATPTPTPTTTVTTTATTVVTTTATPTPTPATTSPTPTQTPSTGIVAGFNGTICFNFKGTNSTPVDHWSWTFGDGDTSYLQNIVHCYIWGNKYTVTLTVTNGTESAILTNIYDLT
jgi:lysophospholipase L1-like esterase